MTALGTVSLMDLEWGEVGKSGVCRLLAPPCIAAIAFLRK